MTVPGNLSSPLLATAADSAAAAYQISRSIRFNSADSARLERTPSSAGNRKTFTWSAWIKFLKDDGEQQLFNAGTNTDYIRLNGNRTAWIKINSAYYGPSAVFRDYGAWYHWVIAVDTTQSTSSDRVKMWVNGVQQTLNQGSGFPSQNASSNFNNTTKHAIGIQNWNNASPSDFYLTENHWIDGQALSATDFGEYDSNNVWQPKEYSGTYGTNGFYLSFSDNTSTTTIAEDSSGNNNDFTAVNISVASGSGNDSLIDTPTNYTAASGNNRGNYATLNVLSGFGTLTNGNLDNTGPTAAWRSRPGTIGMSSGKWYFEWTHNGGTAHLLGIGTSDYPQADYVGSNSQSWGYYSSNGQKYHSSSGSSYGDSWTTGDVIGVAFDADNGNLYFYKNGTAQNSGTAAYTGLTNGPYFPVISLNGTANTGSINFGQRPFAISSIPTGYSSLVTTNLSESAYASIPNGSKAMDIKTYSGTGSTQSIESFGFSPDLVWLKCTNASKTHRLYDSVRGATKVLQPDIVDEEATDSAGLTSFNSDGFTLGGSGGHNGSTDEMISWAWDAGTSTASNTDGSITSNVRVSQANGFSIVTYSASGSTATIGHGLNAAPGFIIVKSRTNADGWPVYHQSLDNTSNNYLTLHVGNSVGSITNYWDGTNSSVIGTLGGYAHSTSGEDYVAYCWTPIEGFSSFGSYSGNGSADGPFVFTGHRARFLIIKCSTKSGEDWVMLDTARDTYNDGDSSALYASLAHANDSTSTLITTDILSNGFKVRATNAAVNQLNETYVYMSFASHPFRTARAR